jgi:hypothetical protein
MSRNKLVLTDATSTVPRMLSTAEVAVILNVSRRIVLDCEWRLARFPDWTANAGDPCTRERSGDVY